MNNIKKYPFSELYEMSSGISTTKAQAGHGYPFVSFGTVFNNYFLPEQLPDLMDTSEKEQDIYSIKEGDILITRTSETIDELAMSCVATKDYPKATYSGFTKRLRPKTTGIAYHKYLAFYLRSYLFRKAVTNNAFMTLRASFNEDIFSFLNLYLPEYQEQVKIGDMLYIMEQKITLNQKICSELEAMAKTIYDYWFVQFDFPDENGKPYRTSGGEMVWNEQLKREIPKGWKVTKIGNLTTVVTGKEDANFSSPNGKYKFFTCSQEALLCDTPAFSGQAILIAGNGDFNVKHYSGEFNAYQRTYVLIPENQFYYGAMYISAKNQIQAFKNGSNGSIVKFITKGDVENIPFILPNVDSIFHQINKLIEKIELCERENEELTKLRDWLLPMLMNGQVQVE
jgi:type I restriction enzyme, S subunit